MDAIVLFTNQTCLPLNHLISNYDFMYEGSGLKSCLVAKVFECLSKVAVLHWKIVKHA